MDQRAADSGFKPWLASEGWAIKSLGWSIPSLLVQRRHCENKAPLTAVRFNSSCAGCALLTSSLAHPGLAAAPKREQRSRHRSTPNAQDCNSHLTAFPSCCSQAQHAHPHCPYDIWAPMDFTHPSFSLSSPSTIIIPSCQQHLFACPQRPGSFQLSLCCKQPRLQRSKPALPGPGEPQRAARSKTTRLASRPALSAVTGPAKHLVP